MTIGSPPPHALTPHASRAAPLPTKHARLSTRQHASAFNQPLSFDTSKVTNMRLMFGVRSACALGPTALSRSLPVHAACVAAPPNALTPPSPHLFPHRMPAFRLGRTRRRSTKRSASTCPASQTRTACSPCAPRVPCPPTALSRSLPVHAACTTITPRPLTPHRMLPRFDSAGELGPAHLVGVGKLRLAQLSELKPSSKCA